KLRMENARVLLNNTDLPISIISEKVGFTCQSSFTRCFSNHFSQSPKHYRAKR
ncbi:AraC family transcriptional regulator, partial [Vibrio parahaemolyticus]